jgi:threonine dehydrogenase-like Zn-dependent dehydrogenase
MKCKAIEYGADGGAFVKTIDVPQPGPGQIQVEAVVCGICSWDIMTYKVGSKSRYAAPPGHEGVGYVTKIGPGVEGFSTGDRVAGGGFAQVSNLSTEKVYRIPETDIPDEQWLVEPVSCVVTGLDHCAITPGVKIAVLGCGFMGLMLVQGLAHSLVGTVIALDVLQQRVKLAKTLGAHQTYQLGDSDQEEILTKMMDLEIDTVVDTTGAEVGLKTATRIVRRGGRINLFGWIKGGAKVPTDDWHVKGLTVVNSSPSSKLRDPFPPAIDFIQKKIIDLKPLITHVVKLEEYPELLEVAAAGDPGYLKGVVKPNL